MNDATSTEAQLKTICLGDVSEITMGQSPESISLNDREIGLPFLQGCAEFGRRSPTTKVYCNPPLRISRPDSILISVRAPVGTLNWGDQGYCIGRGLAALKAIPAVSNTSYLYYAIAKNVNFLHRRSQGSTFLAISGNDLNIFPIPAFCIKKQKKIAHILQTIDRAIERTEALVDKYQQMKTGLMQDLFTRGIGPDGKLRPPREQAPELYQETPIGWIPKEWDTKPLTSVASYQHGRPFPSADYAEDGVLLLRPGNLHLSGFVVFDESHSTRLPKAWAKKEPSYIVAKGDILMNLTAQSLDDEFLGRVCLYEDTELSLLNQRIARFKSYAAEHQFLYWILRSRQFRSQIERTSQGTKVQHLYNRDLDRVILGIPQQTQEQKGISERLNTISNRIRSEADYLQKIKQQKSGLMHDLLTGKVPVQVKPEDEPETAHV